MAPKTREDQTPGHGQPEVRFQRPNRALSALFEKKAGAGLRQWKKRYLVLDCDEYVLKYFRESRPSDMSKPKASMAIGEDTRVKVVETPSPKRRQRFCVTTGEKSWHLASTDHAQVGCWAEEIRRMISRSRSVSPASWQQPVESPTSRSTQLGRKKTSTTPDRPSVATRAHRGFPSLHRSSPSPSKKVPTYLGEERAGRTALKPLANSFEIMEEHEEELLFLLPLEDSSLSEEVQKVEITSLPTLGKLYHVTNTNSRGTLVSPGDIVDGSQASVIYCPPGDRRSIQKISNGESTTECKPLTAFDYRVTCTSRNVHVAAAIQMQTADGLYRRANCKALRDKLQDTEKLLESQCNPMDQHTLDTLRQLLNLLQGQEQPTSGLDGVGGNCEQTDHGDLSGRHLSPSSRESSPWAEGITPQKTERQTNDKRTETFINLQRRSGSLGVDPLALQRMIELSDELKTHGLLAVKLAETERHHRLSHTAGGYPVRQ